MIKHNKPIKKHKISKLIVIGISAGGLAALKKLISQLDKYFPLPILVVQNISPDATWNITLYALNKLNTVKCQHAKSGNGLKSGNLYMAPSDHHLTIDKDLKMLVTKGAQENR